MIVIALQLLTNLTDGRGCFASVDHGIDSSRFEAFRDVLWSLIV